MTEGRDAFPPAWFERHIGHAAARQGDHPLLHVTERGFQRQSGADTSRSRVHARSRSSGWFSGVEQADCRRQPARLELSRRHGLKAVPYVRGRLLKAVPSVRGRPLRPYVAGLNRRGRPWSALGRF